MLTPDTRSELVTAHRAAALWMRLKRPETLNWITPGLVTGLGAVLQVARQPGWAARTPITGCCPAPAYVRLPRRIGMARVKHLFFTEVLIAAAEPIPARLVNQVVVDEDPELVVDALVQTIAAKSPLGLSHMQRLAADAWETPAPIALRAKREASELHRTPMRRPGAFLPSPTSACPTFEGR